MIEINKTPVRGDEKGAVKRRKSAASVSPSGRSFNATLQKTIQHDIEGTIDQLMDDLRDQEKRFLQYQSDQELEKYRELVRKILSMILDEAFEEKTFKTRRKNWGDYTIVEKINAKLLELTTAITRSNKAFDLMKTVEEIRGLLLDLVY